MIVAIGSSVYSNFHLWAWVVRSGGLRLDMSWCMVMTSCKIIDLAF
jgi:hypothetical protein